ncbi:MAG: hypothetical protein OQK24_02575 [Magnetovibrio sp.]|nr:hypothetical protein [Magnetovibrio sp.]
MSSSESITRPKSILYIAGFAPTGEGDYEIEPDNFPILKQYHADLYTQLTQQFDRVIPATSLDTAMDYYGEYDFIFSVHNSAPFRNSEVFISAFAESKSVPYLGAPPNIRAIAEDKHLAKIVARYLGVRTPEWYSLNVGEPLPTKLSFGGPYIIKPRYGVNSEAMPDNCVQDTLLDLSEEWEKLNKAGISCIIERFIPGDNYSVPIIEGIPYRNLPIISEAGDGSLNLHSRTFKQSNSGINRVVCQDRQTAETLKRETYKIWNEISPVDYFRADWRKEKYSRDDYFLEFNVCCNLGKKSAMTLAAKTIGLSWAKLIDHLIVTALRRQPSSR